MNKENKSDNYRRKLNYSKNIKVSLNESTAKVDKKENPENQKPRKSISPVVLPKYKPNPNDKTTKPISILKRKNNEIVKEEKIVQFKSKPLLEELESCYINFN